MTREDIIRMAREALGAPYSSYLEKRRWDISDKQLERFAALVAAAERERIKAANAPEIELINEYIKTLEEAVAAEREACIALCEEHWRNGGNAMECADSIRARGKE